MTDRDVTTCQRCHGSGVDPLSGSGDDCANCGGLTMAERAEHVRLWAHTCACEDCEASRKVEATKEADPS